MPTELRTIDDLDVGERRVLLRTDFDVPLVASPAGSRARVADDRRIRAGLDTIEELRLRGARLVIVSHLGRPQGPDPAWSMQPVADRLERVIGAPVRVATAVTGAEARELSELLEPGQMLMLENLRFEPGEILNDPGFAARLAELADLYVNDAFASAHRRHASTWAVAGLLPSAAGRLMEREVNALSAVIEQPLRPLIAILGGAKLGERIGVIRRFLELADIVCIGGAICVPFLAGLGHSTGRSLCSRDDVARARTALGAAAGRSERLELPRDLLLAKWDSGEDPVTEPLAGLDIPDGWMALDIGRRTAHRYATEVLSAGTVFWSGPMGRFELSGFAAGTSTIAQAAAATSAVTVVGGGETLSAVRQLGLEQSMSHLSSGDGAMVAFLEGRELPAVQALLRDAQGGRGAITRIA
jgi:phosphoglycerate kinase